MKLLYLFFLFISVQSLAQHNSVGKKAVIDTTAIFSDWTELGLSISDDVTISGDGHVFSYRKKKRWDSNEKGVRIVQSVNNNKILYTFPFDIDCFFSRDSKRFVYWLGDEIVDLDIFSGKKRKIDGVSNVNFPEARKGEMLLYQVKNSGKLMIEYLSHPNKSISCDSVRRYVYDKEGNVVVCLSLKLGKEVLRIMDLRSGETSEREISVGCKLESISIEESGSGVVFVEKSIEGGVIDRRIWLFSFKTRKVKALSDRRLADLSQDEYINNMPPFFSGDGKYLFFRVEKIKQLQVNPDMAKVNIWNYLDFKLKNGCRLDRPISYTFSVSLDKGNILRIEDDSIRMMNSSNRFGDYVFLTKPIGDKFWKKYDKTFFWVLSLKTGVRSRFASGVDVGYCYYSPEGRYILYCDSIGQRWDYYAYNTANGFISNLTKEIPASEMALLENNLKKKAGHGYLHEVAGWIPDENAVLIYDSFDLLKVFLSGGKKYQSVTNGYGRRNNTRLALTFSSDKNYYSSRDTLLFTAFNWNNKYNGFYSKPLNKLGDPDSIAMKPWLICGYGSRILPSNDQMMDKGIIPIKANDTTLWLVKCNSSRSAPNYYITSDFREFKKLTNVEPHTYYNWYTTELMHWAQYDGTLGSGVLYKPEDFDSTKKYPLIIYNYRELSQLLHYYYRPELTEAFINIPWFVSRGYLVFAPDVYVQEDGSGTGAFNAVASAAEWLSTLPYVNKYKIGLNGHSQAGFQTNYVIAHTPVFAAALSGAGGADAILSSFINPQCGIERFQLIEERLGSIWEKPQIYIKNSPFWMADKITTPLLLFHCKKDDAVPWELSVQFFMSLWRSGKPVWMLQYDDGGHAVTNKRDLLDYSKRVDQFFDYFLKDSLPPEWMTKGVKSTEKGIDTGFQLDSSYFRSNKL